ncbi:hypothetical protein CCP4SC76_7440022 [Gammaproteobacteria bacterium]
MRINRAYNNGSQSFAVRFPMSVPVPSARGSLMTFLSRSKTLILMAVAALLLSSSLFVVSPTEMAGVRRFGIVTTPEPVGPGIHFKLPLIDQVDRLQVSLDLLRIQDLIMYTVDNQWLKISVGLSYRIPPRGVFRLLYEVGRAGSFGIRENIEPIVADRSMRIFARRNTIKISEEREAIANEIRQAVANRLDELFRIEVVRQADQGVPPDGNLH